MALTASARGVRADELDAAIAQADAETDALLSSDGTAELDAATQPDASTQVDASSWVDASALVDASAPLDGGAAADAAREASDGAATQAYLPEGGAAGLVADNTGCRFSQGPARTGAGAPLFGFALFALALRRRRGQA